MERNWQWRYPKMVILKFILWILRPTACKELPVVMELIQSRHGCQMAVVCRYRKGAQGKHGVQHLLFVVYRADVALHQLPQHYRDRFGIETSYRLKNQCRIRTSTKNPVLRLLFVAVAFILVNLWIWLLWQFVSVTRRGGRRVYQERFPLKTMMEFICHAIEQHFPVIHEVYLPSPKTSG